MTNWRLWSISRLTCIYLTMLLNLGVLITDALILVSVNEVRDKLTSVPVSNASAWTMFVTVFTLLILPLLVTPFPAIQRRMNRTGVELCVFGLLALFYFIAAITLATKSSSTQCMIISLCRRTRAATAFGWLTFVVLLWGIVVIGMVVRAQSRLGLPMFTAYSFDRDETFEGQDAEKAQQTRKSLSPSAVEYGTAYYN